MINVFPGSRYAWFLVTILVACVASQVVGADRVAKAFFVEPPKGAPEMVYLVAPEQEAIEVPLPSRIFSPDVVLPKGDLVYAVLPRALNEGEAVPKGAPMIKIPKDWSRCYLLFVFNKENKVFPLEVIPIDGSLNEFPIGHSRIVNLSQALVKGKFGDDIITIRPGGIENMDPQMKEFGSYPVVVDFLMKGDEKSQPLARTSWQHNPKSRQVVLITKPQDVKYPRFKVIQDRIPVPVEN